MAFDSATVVSELRHLLIGQYEREGQRRGTRTVDAFTTVVGCPKTNEEFIAVSGVGVEWTKEDTWQQVKRVLEAPRSDSPEANAARYLLYLQKMWVTPGSVDEREWRQQRAAEVLGLDWDSNKFRFRDDRTVKFASDIVDRALIALQDALLTATQSAAARASAAASLHAEHSIVASGWTEDVEAELVRRLARLPLHYPAHLTTSILAPMLNPHIRVPADDPDPDAVPTLPPLWRDESEDTSELLRAAGARAYVVGEPGTGKSTLLRSITLTQMKELPGAVGVFVPLIDLAEELPERTLPLPELLGVLIDLSARLYAPVDAEARKQVLRRLEADDSTVLCLDGLDEVPEGALADRVRRAIEALADVPGAVVVSSRPGPRVSVPAGWDTVTMQSVRSESAKQLLELWFESADDPRKARALAILESDVASDISGSPLLLGFVAYAASFDREFDSLSDLYEQYIALTLERIWKTAGLHEPSDVVIENLMHLARLLAWRMAYGDDDQKDASRWRESETLSQILRTVERPDREDLARIVQAEGLFTMAVAAASRLHTSYRWVHRTVQEHLVAMYMQEREGGDPSTMVERLLGLLASGDDWRVVATHLFTRMTSDAQLALIRRLIDAQDDPRYITGEPDKLLEGLAEHFQDEAALAMLAEDARQRGAWPAWFYVDPDGARTALLAAADTEAPIDVIGADAPQTSQHFDVDYLRDLISRLIKRPKQHYGALLEACTALESREPLAGVFAFFDVIAAGPPGLARHPWPKDLLEGMDLATVAQRISEHPDRAVRWRLLHFFMFCLHGMASLFLVPEGPLDPVDFDLVQIVEKKIIGSAHRLGNTMRGAIAGDYGDVIAYVAAKGLTADAVREVVEHPWGIVGAWEHVLINGGNAGGTALIRDEPHSAVEVMAAYDSGWRSDPERMRQLYRAFAESMLRPDTVDTATFTELYRKVLCDPDRSEFDYVNARVAIEAIEKTLDAVIRIRGYVDIAEEILRQEPEAWAGSDGRIPVLEAYLSDRYRQREDDWGDEEYEQHWHEVSQVFYDVTNWGARAGLPLMPLFVTHFMEAPTTRELTLGSLNRDVLSIPRNLSWLDHTMMLFYRYFWRENRSKYLAPLLTEGTGTDGPA
ncbi:NACHT domain-containing NTPase [Microbacterium sp. HA-8]|uniref:NACHT domain-containing protein n=1 Tax=Microbacterium sp. HA-8 TaxID=3234200 RepID=UPI0038F6DCF5